LQRCKIEKAKQLLADPTLKIADIAKMTGYSDTSHFSKRFKNWKAYRLFNIEIRKYRRFLLNRASSKSHIIKIELKI